MPEDAAELEGRVRRVCNDSGRLCYRRKPLRLRQTRVDSRCAVSLRTVSICRGPENTTAFQVTTRFGGYEHQTEGMRPLGATLLVKRALVAVATILVIVVSVGALSAGSGMRARSAFFLLAS